MNTQPDLFTDIAESRFLACHPEECGIQERFEKFHRENPEVYQLFVKIALSYAGLGYKRISAKAILEQVRCKVDTRRNAGTFRLNNNYSAHYARLFRENHPDFKAIIVIRNLRAK